MVPPLEKQREVTIVWLLLDRLRARWKEFIVLSLRWVLSYYWYCFGNWRMLEIALSTTPVYYSMCDGCSQVQHRVNTIELCFKILEDPIVYIGILDPNKILNPESKGAEEVAVQLPCAAADIDTPFH